MSKPSRVSELDVLRFAAAASVMLYHYLYRYEGPASPLMHGYLGVDVFFVISGFVVLWSARGHTAGGFVRARALRLYPEFWVAVVITALVFTAVPGGWSGPSGADLLLNLTMLPGYLGAEPVDRVYWTLAVEIKFYVLLWLLVVCRQLGRIEGWLYGWLLVSLAQTVADLGPIVASLTIFPYGPLFAAGGLFFLVFDSGWTRLRAAGLLIGLALSSYHAATTMDGFVAPNHITPEAQGVAVAVVVLTFVFFMGLGRYRMSARHAGVAALAGGLTYPLYLLHNVAREMFPGGEIPPPYVPLAVGFSVALAYGVMRMAQHLVRPALAWAWDRTVTLRLRPI
jgi:peptidoglycan/LPS O-acetylase OafA/YrhL